MWRSTPSRADAFPAALRRAWELAVCTARLTIGLPDYEAYVAHLRLRHPDRTPMGREAFFRERLAARYGRGRSRCC